MDREDRHRLLFVILVVFLPFVAVGYKKGIKSGAFWVNVLLTILISPLGAVVHAFYVLGFPPRDSEPCGYRELDDEAAITGCGSCCNLTDCGQCSTCEASAAPPHRFCSECSTQACREEDRCIECDRKKSSPVSEGCGKVASGNYVPEIPNASSSDAGSSGPGSSDHPPAYVESEMSQIMDNKVQSNR